MSEAFEHMKRNKIDKSREILIKNIEKEDYGFGKSPRERSIEELFEAGVINLDKPVGPSSHEVTAWLKKLLGISKIAHAGTLEAFIAGEIPRFQEYCL